MKERLAQGVGLATDGLKTALIAVRSAFGADGDCVMLARLYGPSPDGENRDSLAECIATTKKVIHGSPKPASISMSYVERQNLTMRMSMTRSTRLTNAFSRKIENHMAAIRFHFMWYDSGRVSDS